MNDDGADEDICKDGKAKSGNRETQGTKQEIIPARTCVDRTPEGLVSAACSSL